MKFAAQTLFIQGREVSLREALPTDAEKAIPFLQQIAKESTFTYNYEGQSISAADLEKRYQFEAQSSSNLRLFVLHKEELIAQLGIWKTNPKHPWLQHRAEFAMMILKSWWGTGISIILLSEMEKFSRSVGITRIEATVSTDNPRGIALYQKFGFAIEGTAKHAKLVNGKFMDSHFIAKLL
jgi:RimJ/RimL family protein N-acetyltransferase